MYCIYIFVYSGTHQPPVLKTTNTLGQLLVWHKDKIITEKVVGPVYIIKCEECEASYLGDTERPQKGSFAEHRQPSIVTSEVSQHINNGHPERSTQPRYSKLNPTVRDNFLKTRIKWCQVLDLHDVTTVFPRILPVTACDIRIDQKQVVFESISN